MAPHAIARKASHTSAGLKAISMPAQKMTQPVIKVVHVFSPMLIQTDIANFRKLVQEMTGNMAAHAQEVSDIVQYHQDGVASSIATQQAPVTETMIHQRTRKRLREQASNSRPQDPHKIQSRTHHGHARAKAKETCSRVDVAEHDTHVKESPESHFCKYVEDNDKGGSHDSSVYRTWPSSACGVNATAGCNDCVDSFFVDDDGESYIQHIDDHVDFRAPGGFEYV